MEVREIASGMCDLHTNSRTCLQGYQNVFTTWTQKETETKTKVCSRMRLKWLRLKAAYHMWLSTEPLVRTYRVLRRFNGPPLIQRHCSPHRF
jgi:hypothetical protein